MVTCKLANCTFPTDGRCLEGRGNACPNLVTDPAGTPETQEKTLTLEVSEDSQSSAPPYTATESLYSGLPLEIGDAREFSARSRAIVVALAGMKESGKTSLIVRLHQQFQSGPVAGYDFAGSRTLWQFENLNWLATLESGVSSPTMERSSRQYDNSFLHFTVRLPVPGAEPIDLLINDISGETYPDAITTESVCRQLKCLRRADHLGVVVDCAAIADRDFRHDHCAKAKDFVDRVLQTEQIGKQTVLHLIISKLDVLEEAKRVAGTDEAATMRAAETDEAATRLENDFKVRFADRVGAAYTWRLAARPLDGSMPTEETIAKLFGTWVSSTLRYPATVLSDSVSANCGRDFSCFGV